MFLGNLGIAYRLLGRYPEALERFQQALHFAREIGDRRSEGILLGNLGIVYKNLGDNHRAKDSYLQAINIGREIGDKGIEGSNVGNLGIVYKELGNYPKAAEHYQQAINIGREIGDKHGVAMDLGNLGDLYLRQGQLDQAEAALREAIPSCDEGVVPAAGAFRGSLALVLAKLEQLDKAQDLLTTGESQVEAVPDEHAKFLCKKAQVQLIAAQADEALASLNQAKGLAAELNVGPESELAKGIAETEALLGKS